MKHLIRSSTFSTLATTANARAPQAHLAALIRQCGDTANLAQGRRLHESIAASGNLDRFLENHLVQMYGKCSSVKDALATFRNIAWKNVFSWTVMLAAYAQNGHLQQALHLFRCMDLDGIRPDSVTFLTMLGVCASAEDHITGYHLHCRIAVAIAIDVVVGTALIHMYCKCGLLDRAWDVFCEIPDPNLLTWTTIIAAHTEIGYHRQGMDLFRQMLLDGIRPDRLVVASVVDSMSVLGVKDQTIRSDAASIREWIFLSGLERDAYLRTGLITMYGRWGLLYEARSLFFADSILDTNVVSWTSMISACSHHGRIDLAMEIFRRMSLEGVKHDEVSIVAVLDAFSSDPTQCPRDLEPIETAVASDSCTAIGNSMINLYGKTGRTDRALDFFRKMWKRDVVSWGSIITAFAQTGQNTAVAVLALLQSMDFEGIKPDGVVFVSAIDACKSGSRLADTVSLHARAAAIGIDRHTAVSNSLLDAYSKCGRLDLAMEVFSSIRSRDTVAWNTIVVAFAQHGDWIRAVELLQSMNLEGIDPSRVTIISILSACRHAGLLDEARGFFVAMEDDHGMDPALLHYGSMIDLLGRAGWLEQAEELVRAMPVEPAAASVTSLLGSCRIHGDMRRASGAATGLEVESGAAGGLALLSNIYAGTLSR